MDELEYLVNNFCFKYNNDRHLKNYDIGCRFRDQSHFDPCICTNKLYEKNPRCLKCLLRKTPDLTNAFYDTLLYEYIQTADKANDYDLLYKLIQNRQKNKPIELPPSDTLVVHLRLGDYHVGEEWERAKKEYYSIYEVAYNIGIKKIILVSAGLGHHGFQTGANYITDVTRSCEVLIYMKQELQKLGMEVIFRVGNHPDDDLIYFSLARNFLTLLGGNYSVVASNLNKLHWSKFK